MMRQPWILYRYLGRELLILFGMSVAALSLLFMIVLGIQAVQAGFKLGVILEWIFKSLGHSLYFTVPVSLLVSSSLCYGRVAADREYTALTASGMSPLTLYVPMLTLSLFFTLIAFATQGTVLPNAHYSQRNIARYLIKQLEHLGTGKQGRLEIKGGKVSWDEHSGPNLRRVMIQKEIATADPSDNAFGEEPEEEDGDKEPRMVQVTVTAELARVTIDEDETVNLRLTNVGILASDESAGMLFQDPKWTNFFQAIKLERSNIVIPLNEKRKREGDMTSTELVEYRQHWATMESDILRDLAGDEITAEERAHKEKSLPHVHKRLRKIDAEVWNRRALALSCFTFAFLGFPLSLSFRYRHRLTSFFVGGMLIVIVFYPLLLLGETLAEAGSVPAPVGLMAGNVILIMFSAFCTGRLLFR